jgi:hypothetical protein
MKKITFLFASLVILLLSNVTHAQTSTDYFVGDWNVIVTGIPNGDSKMVLHLERVDGKLTGEMRGDQGDPIKLESVEEK